MNRHRKRDCPSYSPLWAGDFRRKLFAALDAYPLTLPSGVRQAQVHFGTVTAPGVDFGLVWEPGCAETHPGRSCSGPHGCSVAAAPAAFFNAHAPAWWTEMWNYVAQRVERELDARPNLLVRCFEMQKRGVLHVHLIYGRSTLMERRTADRATELLHQVAARFGWGYVDRKAEVREPRSAAAYLSAYFCDGPNGKMTLRESVTAHEMPRSIIYVKPLLSQTSGVTMRSLRLVRFAWVLLRQLEERNPGVPLDVLEDYVEDRVWGSPAAAPRAP